MPTNPLSETQKEAATTPFVGEPQANSGGDKYLPYSERLGNESIVYFTRDLSAEGLRKAWEAVADGIDGRVAVKLHTGEPHGPNILPHAWVQALLEKDLPGATIVETNTFYEGGRDTTKKHRETLKTNGWTFCPVDILDEETYALLPVKGGKWFREMAVGANLVNYDSMAVLTHFKGHLMGGFGGSDKNVGIGCASGKEGKKWIHQGNTGEQWGISKEEMGERFTECTKAVLDHFGKKIAFVNVMRNMSVDCDCAGVEAAPVVTPNVGILASTDVCAIDTACVDIVYALPEKDSTDLRERMESRHGLGQLTYMKELGMGNMRYALLDMDNGGARITAAEAAAAATPFAG